LPMSAMNANRSRLSAKYWNRLPLATPARRAMTFRLPRENPCAPNSDSAASMIAARRAGSTRAQVTVGNAPPQINDHWSFYCETPHSQGVGRSRCSVCVEPHVGARVCGLPHARRVNLRRGVRLPNVTLQSRSAPGVTAQSQPASKATTSRPHPVGAAERQDVLLPNLVVAGGVVRGAANHPDREAGLCVRRRWLVAQLHGVGVEV